MRSVTFSCVLALLLLPTATQAQSPELSKTVQEFVRVRAPKIVLAHVRIIDGTGGPAVEDQNVIIEAGKIAGIQKGSDLAASAADTDNIERISTRRLAEEEKSVSLPGIL